MTVLKIRDFVRDLSEAARTGKLERTFGMEAHVRELLQRVTGPNRRSVLLVGPSGVGKTTLVHALAATMSRLTDPAMRQYRILEIDLAAMRTAPDGVEQAAQSILEDIKASIDTIAFIDEIAPIFLMKDVQGDQASMARIFGPAIKQRYIACIGTLTDDAYSRVRQADPSIDQVFTVIPLRPYKEAQTRELLALAAPALEIQHGVQISSDAIEAAIKYSKEYMPNEAWPGKAIEVLDQACARYKLKQRVRQELPEVVDEVTMRHLGPKVSPHDVKRVITELTSIDIDATSADQWKTQLATRLNRHILGQERALKRIAASVAAAKTNFGAQGRPLAAMVFAGPRGVGKLHTAQVLARHLFGDENSARVFPMEFYSGPDGTSQLLGASLSASEVGDFPSISTAIRSGEFSICVFEGVEHADPSFFHAMMPVLATGVLRDAHRKQVNLHRCIFVFTLNLPEAQSSGKDGLLKHIPHELLQRIDAVVSFESLAPATVRAIIRRQLEEFHSWLKPHGVSLRVQEAAFNVLQANCYCAESGADRMSDTLDTLVIRPIREFLQGQGAKPGLSLDVIASEKGIAVTQTLKERS